MPAKLYRADEKYFWSFVDKRSKGCWNWKAGLFTHGYGQFHIESISIQAHRVSWFLKRGPIPKGKCVLHHCDNRKCVRPSHLFIGTKSDNNRDAFQKCRHYHGQRHWKAVLSERAVKEIRRLYKTGKYQSELARKFGVGQPHISTIVRRRAWRHVAQHG